MSCVSWLAMVGVLVGASALVVPEDCNGGLHAVDDFVVLRCSFGCVVFRGASEVGRVQGWCDPYPTSTTMGAAETGKAGYFDMALGRFVEVTSVPQGATAMAVRGKGGFLMVLHRFPQSPLLHGRTFTDHGMLVDSFESVRSEYEVLSDIEVFVSQRWVVVSWRLTTGWTKITRFDFQGCHSASTSGVTNALFVRPGIDEEVPAASILIAGGDSSRLSYYRGSGSSSKSELFLRGETVIDARALAKGLHVVCYAHHCRVAGKDGNIEILRDEKKETPFAIATNRLGHVAIAHGDKIWHVKPAVCGDRVVGYTKQGWEQTHTGPIEAMAMDERGVLTVVSAKDGRRVFETVAPTTGQDEPLRVCLEPSAVEPFKEFAAQIVASVGVSVRLAGDRTFVMDNGVLRNAQVKPVPPLREEAELLRYGDKQGIVVLQLDVPFRPPSERYYVTFVNCYWQGSIASLPAGGLVKSVSENYWMPSVYEVAESTEVRVLGSSVVSTRVLEPGQYSFTVRECSEDRQHCTKWSKSYVNVDPLHATRPQAFLQTPEVNRFAWEEWRAHCWAFDADFGDEVTASLLDSPQFELSLVRDGYYQISLKSAPSPSDERLSLTVMLTDRAGKVRMTARAVQVIHYTSEPSTPPPPPP
eukprot:Sspe_Gene.76948::Locus_48055_Transcript_1_1_Confidence_1.000_Length_1962::g.76948::m.76948